MSTNTDAKPSEGSLSPSKSKGVDSSLKKLIDEVVDFEFTQRLD